MQSRGTVTAAIRVLSLAVGLAIAWPPPEQAASQGTSFAGGDAAGAAQIHLNRHSFTPDPGVAADVGARFQALRDRQTVHVLIQFRAMPDPALRTRLRDEWNVRLLDPVPERGFFAAMPPDPALAARLVAQGGPARWIGVMAPKDKISPTLGVVGRQPPEEGRQDPAGRPPPMRLAPGMIEAIVRFFADVAPAERRRVLDRPGVRILEEQALVHSFRVGLAPAAIAALAREDAVKSIVAPPPPGRDDNNGMRSPTGANVDYAGTSGLHDQPYRLTGYNVVVGQWETTHTSRGHPDLNGRVVLGDAAKPDAWERALRHSEDVLLNEAFDVGEAVYRDNDDDLTVSVQDDRLSEWGALGPGEVAAGDADLGAPLSRGFTNYFKYGDVIAPFAGFQNGEGVYHDVNQNEIAEVGELRVTAVSSAPGYPAGTTVAAGDTDENQALRRFPSNDPHDHSTHVAGTLLGSGAQSATFGGSPLQWKGVAPGATLRSYDIASLSNDYLDAASNGVALSNNSWGTRHCHWQTPPDTCYDVDSELYDTVISGRDSVGNPSLLSRRILVFGSAGNAGEPERYVDSNGNARYDDGEAIYTDENDSGAVEAASDRLRTGTAEPDGTPLVNFALDEMHDESSFVGGFGGSEGIYRDRDGSGTVTAGDERITPAAGSGLTSCVLPCTVVAGDSDVDANQFLRAFKLWGTVRIPNSAKNTLEIANIASDTKLLSPSSSRGPTDDGRLKSDLAAPGFQEITLADPPTLFHDNAIRSSAPPDLYQLKTGTSMATPVVTGMAALLTEWHQIACDFPDPPPEVLRAILIHAAEDLTDIPNVAGSFVGPDYAFGYGRARAKKAIDLLAHHGRGSLSTTGQVIAYTMTIGRMRDLKVTLAWDDPPYTANAAPSPLTGILHNDLNLTLIAPDGTRHTPWQLDPSDPFAPATRATFPAGTPVPPGARDHRNTVEQVLIDNAMAGTWTIRVRASRLSLPVQSFAVVSEMLAPEDGACSAQPASDLWLRDSQADTGATPSVGAIVGPDIVNRNAADGVLVDQPIVFGQTNYLYVFARNAHQQASARPVIVDVWITGSANAAWPADFHYLGRLHDHHVSPNTARMLGPLAWTPPAGNPPGLFRVYVRLQNVQDPIGSIETADVIANIRASNNISGRALAE